MEAVFSPWIGQRVHSREPLRRRSSPAFRATVAASRTMVHPLAESITGDAVLSAVVEMGQVGVFAQHLAHGRIAHLQRLRRLLERESHNLRHVQPPFQ